MLAWTSSTPAFVLGAEDLLVKAIQALLETAVKFSDTGKTVRLACHFVPDAVNIAIESRGRDCIGGAVSVEDRHPSGIEMTVSLRCTESLSAINPEVEAAQPSHVVSASGKS
jgi:hypothetical protein